MSGSELKELEKIIESGVEESKNKLESAVKDNNSSGILWYESEMNTLEYVLKKIQNILDRE